MYFQIYQEPYLSPAEIKGLSFDDLLRKLAMGPGGWRWRLMADNGLAVSHSDNFVTRADCQASLSQMTSFGVLDAKRR